MSNWIDISKKMLPEGEQAALDYLYGYFNGCDIKYHISSDCYSILLSRSDFAYCEDVIPGLKSINIDKRNLADFCFVNDNSCLCLSENWIPFGWSVLASKQQVYGKKISIIHIDDHSDLMSPFICFNNKYFYNMLNGEQIDFLMLIPSSKR